MLNKTIASIEKGKHWDNVQMDSITFLHRLLLACIRCYVNSHCTNNLFPMKYKLEEKLWLIYTFFSLFLEEFVGAVPIILSKY